MSADERCSLLHEERRLFSPDGCGVCCVSDWEGRYLWGSCMDVGQYRIAGFACGRAAAENVGSLF